MLAKAVSAFPEDIFSLLAIAHTYKAKVLYIGTDYYLRPHDIVAESVQLHERNQLAWNQSTTDLGLLKWRLGKENVAGWCKGIDISTEVATKELTDDSNFNLITWYKWVIKGYGDRYIL